MHQIPQITYKCNNLQSKINKHPLPISQGALTQNPMHTNLNADQSLRISNQQSLQNEQRCNQETNITVEPLRQTAFEM